MNDLLYGLTQGGGNVFENDSVESDCMGDSVESDHGDKSDINETDDKQIV